MTRDAVAAVIPNRDGGALLDRCLAALGAATGVDEVIVVDDGSRDGSPERAAAAGARVIRSDGRGFAAALNRGVAATGAPYVLALNSDAFVRPDAVERLAGALRDEPRLALCGARLVDGDGHAAKSHGDLLTMRRALEIALGVPGRQPPSRPGLQHVEFVPLACALARRRALDGVGGLDEGYRFYFEDYDLCWRLAEAGWTVAVLWTAEAVHVGGGSSSSSDPAGWLVQFQASRLRYLRRRYPHAWRAFAAAWVPNALAHAALWSGRASVARARGDGTRSRAARRWADAYARSARPRPSAGAP